MTKTVDDSNGLSEYKNINKVSNWLEIYVKPLWRTVIYLRIPVVITLVAWLTFTGVDQTLEIYRAIALDRQILQAAMNTFFMALLSIFIWYSSRLLVYEREKKRGTKPQDNTQIQTGCDVEKFGSEWIPRILGIIPIFSLSWGILKTWQYSPNRFLMIWLVLNSIVGFAVFALLVYRKELNSSKLPKQFQGKLTNQILDTFAAGNREIGLFNPQFEIGFVTCFCVITSLLSLPLIKAATKSVMPTGMIALFSHLSKIC